MGYYGGRWEMGYAGKKASWKEKLHMMGNLTADYFVVVEYKQWGGLINCLNILQFLLWNDTGNMLQGW